MPLLEGPELRKHYWWDREEKKSPAHGGIQTRALSVMRHALYRCDTTAAQSKNDKVISVGAFEARLASTKTTSEDFRSDGVQRQLQRSIGCCEKSSNLKSSNERIPQLKRTLKNSFQPTIGMATF